MEELNTLVQQISIDKIIIYFVAINLVAFCAMWLDKRKAQKGAWRIPEETLFIFAFLGGVIGGIAGMYTFRHKTRKPKFVIGFPLILILYILIILKIFGVF